MNHTQLDYNIHFVKVFYIILFKAKFFNTTRTLSFLLESIFLFLGISIIKYLKEKQPSEKGDLSKSFLSHYSRVETRF